MTSRPLLHLPLLVLLGLAAFAATPVLSASSESADPAEAVMIHAYLKEGVFHFAPAEVHVAPGGTVVLGHLFGNHSLTSPDGLFNETGGAEHWPTITAPLEPGTYRFYCWLQADPTTTPEQGMAGVLVVETSSDAPAAPRDAAAPALGLAALALAIALAVALRRRA